MKLFIKKGQSKMLTREARQIKAYLQSTEGRSILRTAKMVLRANNIKLQDDDRMGLRSLVLAYALYPNQLSNSTNGLITKSAKLKVDFCSADPALCEGRKAIPRMEMPVLEGKNLQVVTKNLKNGLIDWQNPPKDAYRARYAEIPENPSIKKELQGKLIEITSLNAVQAKKLGLADMELGYDGVTKYHQRSADKPMPVSVKQVAVKAGSLKPTQSEINFAKSFGMAQNYLLGKFKGLATFDPDNVTIVSKEGYIIDGHHRWAAIGLVNAFSTESMTTLSSNPDEPTLLNLVQDENAKGISEWLKSNKGGGDTSIKMPVVWMDLPIKTLLPCLNACTDSLGVARKPFDEDNPHEIAQIIIPKQDEAYRMNTHQRELKDTEDASEELQQVVDSTSPNKDLFENVTDINDDSNNPYSYATKVANRARLANRARFQRRYF